MPLPVIADTLRVTLNWTGPNGTSAANVMHFRGSGIDPTELMALLTNNFVANLFNAVATTAVIDTVHIIPLDGTSATQEFDAPNTALWKGETVSSPVFPDSVVIKLRTGERGRSKRGRVYLPFPAEGAIDLGTVLTGSLGAMQTAWETFRSSMEEDLCPWVVASYKFASALEVESLLVEGALGTQRRRQSRFRRQVGY